MKPTKKKWKKRQTTKRSPIKYNKTYIEQCFD